MKKIRKIFFILLIMAFTICSAGLLWAVPMTNTTGDGFEDYNSVHKDKSTLRVEISTSLITFQDRLIVQGVIRDISEQERFEKQLQQSKKRKPEGTRLIDFNEVELLK